MFCFFLFHCSIPSIQNNVKQIAGAQKYLLNEWMDGWMTALLPDNILSVRFYYYPYYLNEKTDAYVVKWHVPGYLAIKRKSQDLKPSFIGPSSIKCQSLPTKPTTCTTSHSDRPAEGTPLLPFPNESSCSYCSESPGHFICTSLKGLVNSFFILLKGRRTTIY